MGQNLVKYFRTPEHRTNISTNEYILAEKGCLAKEWLKNAFQLRNNCKQICVILPFVIQKNNKLLHLTPFPSRKCTKTHFQRWCIPQ